MSRRRAAVRRNVFPDAKYSDVVVSMFINCVMKCGKKSLAERIVYGAFDLIEKRLKTSPLSVFHAAIKSVRPSVEVRSRRVGGATYQVPVEVRDVRALSLAIKWIIQAALKRSEKTMCEKVAGELMDAHGNKGGAIKTRATVQQQAEGNKAYIHFRW
jgi:small subunit ribosomal protein S7